MHMWLHDVFSVTEGPGLHHPLGEFTQSTQITQATSDASAPVMPPHELHR